VKRKHLHPGFTFRERVVLDSVGVRTRRECASQVARGWAAVEYIGYLELLRREHNATPDRCEDVSYRISRTSVRIL
jgi:hypothetical protein